MDSSPVYRQLPDKVRLAPRKWVQLRFDITPKQLGLSPQFFDKYLAGQKLTVVGTDDFYYLVKDPSNPLGEPLMIHLNHIIK